MSDGQELHAAPRWVTTWQECSVREQADAANHEPSIIFMWSQAHTSPPKAPLTLVRRVGLVAYAYERKVKYVRQWRLLDARGWLILVASGTWGDTPKGHLKELLSNLVIARYGLRNDEEF